MRIERGRQMAIQGVERATALTRRLLAFSRQQALAPRALDANKLVTDVCELLRRTIGEAIVLSTALADDLWTPFADPNQLENAHIEPCAEFTRRNARGGAITIETTNASLDRGYIASLNEPIEPGQYVMIAVSDTGAGMDRTTRERAFDPFFTTKEIGKGTGLGLSQVYGFARQSAGTSRSTVRSARERRSRYISRFVLAPARNRSRSDHRQSHARSASKPSSSSRTTAI